MNTTYHTTLLFFVIVLMFIPRWTAAQTANHPFLSHGLSEGIEEQTIEKGTDLEEALSILEETFGVLFLYRSQLLDQIIIPDAEVIYQNRELSDILQSLLHGSDLTYRQISRRTIGIAPEDKVEEIMDVYQEMVTGTVTDAQTGEALPGVNIVVEGTTTGTTTNVDGEFELGVPNLDATLVITYIGYERQEIELDGRVELDIELFSSIISGDELVVVGYGVQRRSDLTGTVSSVPQERLEMVPNRNISQAIQGAVPGVMVQTTSAGASPNESLMIRGRNSIAADNSPLIVIDGITYGGNISDINPSDIQSIEVLKDASAAAIYGSRGANGVILVTTKEGAPGDTKLTYNSHYSTQTYANLPNVMNGEEFLAFRQVRFPAGITQSELDIVGAGNSVNWMDLGLRNGYSNEHNLSVSGAIGDTRYYISGGFLDVQGITLNDDFKRLTGRINVDVPIRDWLTIGTSTQLSADDRSGIPPNQAGLFYMNPNTTPFDDNGNLTIYPWPEDTFFDNPLGPTLYENINESNQIITNNYAIADFPFLDGLSYRLNVGIRMRTTDQVTYRGRDTATGLGARGSADLSRGSFNNTVVENILSYNRDYGVHTFFTTAVLGYETSDHRINSMSASGFPNDFLSFYAAEQADAVTPGFSFDETTLISQMLRLNYSYDSRYLLTLTGRRDGFSGFGSDSKWGFFPSVALAWNITNEGFFTWGDIFSELKPRISYGFNGNQAIGAYESLTTLSSNDYVDGNETQAGFFPNKLGQENLGWEESRTINVGLDVGLFDDRFHGEINYFQTNTSDLLLDRTISSIHGITSIVQNIGETKNTGFEISARTRNIHVSNFLWTTSGHVSFVKNEIVDLYGDGRDDVANAWFIGHPIRVNYDFVVDGVWQLDEADEAAIWGSQPGFIKIRDVNGDGRLTAGEDRQIIGQQDPKTMWGLTNSFAYKNFSLNIFIHGVHGIMRANPFKTDNLAWAQVRRNTVKKNWWTPDNPTNDFVMNHRDAEGMDGIGGSEQNIIPWFENASFIRIKDVTLSYDIPYELLQRVIGISRLRVYASGRNLHTFTDWGALDPELDGQFATPLQREFTFGVNVEF